MRVARHAWPEGLRGDATPGSTRSGGLPTPPDCRNLPSPPLRGETLSRPTYRRPLRLWPSFRFYTVFHSRGQALSHCE
eukprot:453625-Pleurochrysis_carterae.AAC.1